VGLSAWERGTLDPEEREALDRQMVLPIGSGGLIHLISRVCEVAKMGLRLLL